MSEHTPGPWKVETEGDPALIDAPRIGLYVAHAARVGFSPEATEANARLVAAAPDLLEACVEFVRKVDTGEARSVRSYAQMKAAIAKATGGTP